MIAEGFKEEDTLSEEQHGRNVLQGHDTQVLEDSRDHQLYIPHSHSPCLSPQLLHPAVGQVQMCLKYSHEQLNNN